MIDMFVSSQSYSEWNLRTNWNIVVLVKCLKTSRHLEYWLRIRSGFLKCRGLYKYVAFLM
jgi:hypothetical protein